MALRAHAQIVQYTLNTIAQDPTINEGLAQDRGHWMTSMLEAYPEGKDSIKGEPEQTSRDCNL